MHNLHEALQQSEQKCTSVEEQHRKTLASLQKLQREQAQMEEYVTRFRPKLQEMTLQLETV